MLGPELSGTALKALGVTTVAGSTEVVDTHVYAPCLEVGCSDHVLVGFTANDGGITYKSNHLHKHWVSKNSHHPVDHKEDLLAIVEQRQRWKRGGRFDPSNPSVPLPPPQGLKTQVQQKLDLTTVAGSSKRDRKAGYYLSLSFKTWSFARCFLSTSSMIRLFVLFSATCPMGLVLKYGSRLSFQHLSVT